jgi:hypothetical protein
MGKLFIFPEREREGECPLGKVGEREGGGRK